MVIKIIAGNAGQALEPHLSLVKEMPMAALVPVTEEPLIWGREESQSHCNQE